MSNYYTRLAEREIVRATIENIVKLGWAPETVDIGDGEVAVDTIDAMMNEAFSGDIARIYFKRGAEIAWIFIVLGNAGWDVVSDYTMCLESAVRDTDDLTDDWERRLV